VDPNDLITRGEFATAHGSMNHVAFVVPEEKLQGYQTKLAKAGVQVSPIL
jgi:hypothetical protein